jgi:GrpB-like predicted nucleotidyltransferase (UPF0157 family)
MTNTNNPKIPPVRVAATDENLQAVIVGERPLLSITVYLAPYNPDWPSQFLQQANLIREILDEKVLLLEHVGSTSVPGLAAKPIIDIVLAVADSADESAYVPPLAAKGFILRVREPDWFEHRMFKAPDAAGNLHVFSVGCSEIERILAFRNWLRQHDADRQLYEQTKRDLAAQIWQDIQQYADAKSEVVQTILARAIASMPRQRESRGAGAIALSADA